ncbi:MAG: diguanylate cyclase [Thalassospira sp.]|uniref:sensor domain-containing diguanylate cyclase n=1 Tax=Thalassospira sp. TaxID=1912094 RepID=UPI0032EBF306
MSIWTLHTYSTSQYRTQLATNLNAISELAKKRLLTAVDRIQDNTTLIASRTQLRRQLGLYGLDQSETSVLAMNRILTDANAGMSEILNILIFDPDGQFVTSSIRVDDVVNPKLEDFGGRRIFLMHDRGLMVRSVAKLNFDGRDVGYLVVDFTARFILDLVSDVTGLGKTGEWLFALRDEQGDAVFAVPLKYDRDAAFRRTVPKDRIDIPITQAMLGHETLLEHAPDYLGEPVMASTRYLPSMDWGLVAKINEAEVAEIIGEANKFLLYIGLGIVGAAMFAGIWVAGMIARPIEQLRVSTERLSAGDFDIEPIDAGWREAKDLASSFSEMAGSLYDLRENLQEKVAERTHELDEVNRQLMELSVRDPLTGVHNRRYITQRLDEEFARTRRYNGRLGVAILDIDHFKKINDTHGHAAGDEVLIGLAFCVEHALRSSDLFGRVGGEEFCIVIPEAEYEGVVLLLERIREEIKGLPFQFEGKSISVTCSVGVAFLDEEILSSTTLVECADKALYHAKSTGRNKLVVYSDIPKDELEASTPSNIG